MTAAENPKKKAIREEFLREYASKGIFQISVKELCANTPAARTTFYSYYENVDDLLAEIEDDIIKGLNDVATEVSGGNLPEMDFTEFFYKTMDYIRAHWEEIYVLLIAQPDLRFIEKWKDAIKVHFKDRYRAKVSVSNYGLISETLASGALGAYRYWMKHPGDVNADQLGTLTATELKAITDLI